MGKLGVINLNYIDIIRPFPFKKNLLLFDKLILPEEPLKISRLLVSIRRRSKNFDDRDYIFNNQTIDVLQREGLLEIVDIKKPFVDPKSYEGMSDEAVGTVIAELEKIFFETKKISRDLEYGSEQQNDWQHTILKFASSFPPNFTRLLSLKLNFKGLEAFPLFSQELPYLNIGKKEAVLKFILNKLPEPDNSVSLEQLLEFRKDPATLQKYYSLIKWVNDVAKKDFIISEIQDEYNFLYYEYAEQFKIHRIKSKQGILEIFVTATLDALLGQLQIGNISTSLFSLWKHNINLLETESTLKGREIAYIHRAEKTFK